MKQTSTLLLKLVILFIALVAAFILIKFPQTEGRAVNLDLLSIYTDPFIIYCYIASIPFFIALVQSFKLLTYIDKNNIFSQGSIKAIKTIKYCAISIICFILGAEVYIFMFQRGKEDIAGGVAMGIFIFFVALVITTASAILQRLLQNAVAIKLENDLTV